MKFVDDFVEVLLLIRTPTVGFVVAERCNDWSPPPSSSSLPSCLISKCYILFFLPFCPCLVCLANTLSWIDDTVKSHPPTTKQVSGYMRWVSLGCMLRSRRFG